MKEIKRKYNDFQMAYKSYQILREGLIVPNDELQQLIDFFEKSENYEICKKLKEKIR